MIRRRGQTCCSGRICRGRGGGGAVPSGSRVLGNGFGIPEGQVICGHQLGILGFADGGGGVALAVDTVPRG